MIRRLTILHNNPAKRQRLAAILAAQGCDVTVAPDGLELLSSIAQGCDAAIVDTDTIDIWDEGFLARLRAEAPDLPLVITIRPGRTEGYVAILSTGAWDYLPEPFAEEKVKMLLRRLDEQHSLLEQNRYLWHELGQARGEAPLITSDPAMSRILRQVGKVAATDASVLILGEKGTEKEKVARLVHDASGRKSEPFARVDCTLPEEESIGKLLEKTSGGFAGMVARGTIFLDEITKISPNAQAKLLRMLDNHDGPRMISASSDDPFEYVERKLFREDLFFRLNAAQIFLPALRERTADIPLLANRFMDELGMEKPDTGWDELADYDWPGNVSELEAAVRLAAFRRGSGHNVADDLLPKERRANKRRRFRR